MRIALAQLNPIVGDIAGNTALVLDAIDQARRERAEVLVTSELVLIGYPPRDLLFREGVVAACERAVRLIADHAGAMHVIVGHPRHSGPNASRPFRNSASVCQNGNIIAVCDKQLLPGYDVFDEDRYFEPGARSLVVPINGKHVGVLICEDLWRAKDVTAKRQYSIEPVAECMAQRDGGGCDLILSLNASPFVIGKWRKHVEQMREIATDYHVPVIAVNQVGGNDDLTFDGRSVVVARDGSLAHVSPGFESAVQTIDLESQELPSPDVAAAITAYENWLRPERETYHALVRGVRDYVRKTGNRQGLVGLSGGIDSALVAAIASAALGSENVHGVMMPSIHSSPGSIADALDVAERLRLARCDEISIKAIHEAVRRTVLPALRGTCEGIADENIQARLRGVILMALSNATGALLLSTSNKSEVATGYSTLYGDMCGAVAVLGDLLKTRIYDLSRWINANHAACGFARPPIPENSIAKPPSAELRPNQTDQDTLPPYEILDQIIERFIEREEPEETIITETGFDAGLVRKTLQMIDRAQYKRDQAPVILKLTYRAFGRGRPMPIVMKANVRLTDEDQATRIQRASKPFASSRPVITVNRQS
jgi:NAD+ synthase (glutamine-hydrolysing)